MTTSTGSIIGGSGTVIIESESVTDIVQPGDNDYFNVQKVYQKGGIINGKGTGLRDARNLVAAACYAPNNWPHLGLVNVPTNNEVATKAAARSSPSRPIVDIPVNLLELSDIPKLVKDSGVSLIKKLAGANIKHEFGIKPIAGDLADLLKFKSHVDRRVRTIRKLMKDGYKKTVHVWMGSAQGSKSITFQSQGILIGGTSTGNTIQLISAHCRWKPSVDLFTYSDDTRIHVLAERAVLGMSAEFSTAWDAFPWTWLIDWYINIGDFLMAHRNLVPAHLDEVSIIKHKITTWETPELFSSAATGRIPMSSHLLRREEKLRELGSVTPTAHFPFLSGSQMGIIASLGVLRGRGPR